MRISHDDGTEMSIDHTTGKVSNRSFTSPSYPGARLHADSSINMDNRQKDVMATRQGTSLSSSEHPKTSFKEKTSDYEITINLTHFHTIARQPNGHGGTGGQTISETTF